MTPEQIVHRIQKRLIAGERISRENRRDAQDAAEALGVPQARKDALAAKKQAADDAAKAFHEEAEAACGDIGVQTLSNPGPKDDDNG